ncbi:alpha/beta fold hydrolase [Streptomyces sp. NPDC093111]|uniref:esterase/lipase family protein n=1 Tax=Streptomyces sp. NPDC093111 TaxID=3154978 RepID=UPI00341BFC3E
MELTPTDVADRVKAAALELAVLAGHLVLYPSGLVAERHPRRPVAAGPATGDTGDAGDGGAGSAGGAVTGRPVVLLHGFADNRSVFVLLRRVLARHGRDCVESLDYSPLTGDLRTAAELLGRRVADIRDRTGHHEVDLVGHSLGGLIGRYYVQRLGGDARVRTLVMLGTPHSGTTFVPLADAHPLVRQMRPGSEVLRELAGPAPGVRTRFVSFWSELDQVMVPVETARLDHPDLIVHNVRVSGIGHLALPVHPTVAAGVLDALDADGPAPGAAGAAGAAPGESSVA